MSPANQAGSPKDVRLGAGCVLLSVIFLRVQLRILLPYYATEGQVPKPCIVCKESDGMATKEGRKERL